MPKPGNTGDALQYVLTNWEKIPDKARFVERAFPFAPLSQKENPDLRSLRDELYRRMQMAESPQIRCLPMHSKRMI